MSNVLETKDQRLLHKDLKGEKKRGNCLDFQSIKYNNSNLYIYKNNKIDSKVDLYSKNEIVPKVNNRSFMNGALLCLISEHFISCLFPNEKSF